MNEIDAPHDRTLALEAELQQLREQLASAHETIHQMEENDAAAEAEVRFWAALHKIGDHSDAGEPLPVSTIVQEMSERLTGAIAETTSLRERAEKAERARDLTRDWYVSRWERLTRWAREEVPEDLRKGFFGIITNGTPTPEEPPEYAKVLAMKSHEIEVLKAQVARLQKGASAQRPN